MNSRVKRVKEIMVSKGIDYLILGPGSNCFYLTGFREEQMERPILLVIGQEEAFFVAPKIYREQIEMLGFPGRFYGDEEDPYEKLSLRKGATLAVDHDLWAYFLLNITSRFNPLRVSGAGEVMREVRKVKEEWEIEVMREGVKIAERSLWRFIPMIKEGMEEVYLSRKLEELMIEEGGEGSSFTPIVTSGPNTSMPHLRSTRRKVKLGEPLVVDFGLKLRGYSTDTTRTFALGEPDEEFLEVYNVVREAQESAITAVGEGVRAMDVDRAARLVISSSGYGEFFIHRTGHGVGIDVHEDPYISQVNAEELISNEVFTVEPGIYLPNKFGVRIEDMILVKGREGLSFNSFTKELIVL